jgi:hypothetical protein
MNAAVEGVFSETEYANGDISRTEYCFLLDIGVWLIVRVSTFWGVFFTRRGRVLAPLLKEKQL